MNMLSCALHISVLDYKKWAIDRRKRKTEATTYPQLIKILSQHIVPGRLRKYLQHNFFSLQRSKREEELENIANLILEVDSLIFT